MISGRVARRLLPPVIAAVVAGAATTAAVGALGDGGEAPPRSADRAAPVDAGRALFARMGCGTCHRLSAANSAGGIGPDLDEQLAGHTRTTLTAKIVDPYPTAEAERFAVMPDDYARRMSADELRALVSFLLAARTR